MKKLPFPLLRNYAKSSLEANIVTTDEGLFLAAGGHQFGSLWTRDFCLASRGLLALDRQDVVRNHVTRLVQERREHDGLIPRIVECMPSWKRVVAHTALRFLPKAMKSFPMKAPLKAEHLGEHGTISIDSNALVLRTCADLQRRHPDAAWLEENRGGLQQVLEFCLGRVEGGNALVTQGRFEDWQDSASRKGRTAYTNVLYAIAFQAAKELGLRLPPQIDDYGAHVRQLFLKSNVLRSVEDLDLVSLDANLFAILDLSEKDFEREKLYAAVKRHPIWSKAEIPGVASDRDYPNDWISWTTKIVGLTHYHDRLLWTWLSGLSAKAAVRCGDLQEADRIFSHLEKIATRDQGIGEVYRPQSGTPLFETLLYRSELPFSWGSGCILEALEERESLVN